MAPGGGAPDNVPEIVVSGVVVLNQGRAWVSAARVLVPATGQFVSCGNIAPGARCATGFPDQQYRGYPVEFTWSQEGAIHSTGELNIDVPAEAIESGRASLRVWIMGPGSAAVEVVALSEAP